MDLNGLVVNNIAVMAPMAGCSDIVMRSICDYYGAGFTVSEMVSARALNYGDVKSRALMKNYPHNGKYGVQLFGFDPRDFAVATKITIDIAHPDFIDINMGCPAPKIVNNNSGSALMKDIPLATQIAKTVVDNAGNTPVSVKMRKGWNENCVTCIELAQSLESAGVSFITVHGRTRAQMYNPGVDLDIIKKVKQSVSIPVIANGDINSVDSALRTLEYTGADGIMLARRALSTPWLFSQIKQAYSGLNIDSDPDIYERMQLLLCHCEKLCNEYGEKQGMRIARTQCSNYIKGFKNASKFRFMTNSLACYSDAKDLAQAVIKDIENV